jgi:pre-mRNA-splicing factor CDC5/CEF1
MAQAQNLVRLNQLQTPLLGGDNPELHPSDWSGLTPKPAVAATPNPLAARAAAAGATPLVGATPAGETGRHCGRK